MLRKSIATILLLAAVPAAGDVTPIATIQNNRHAYLHQVVTIEGQVYIPTNYRGSTTSGYIQDGSGRGINLFGSTANDPRLRDIGNIVQVTGTVDSFFTTTEIVNLTSIVLLSSGNPPLEAVHLTTGAARSSMWEGTFIEVSGTITQKATTGSPSSAFNYTVNDGTGPVVVRVVNTVGASEFEAGQHLTGRGAGSQFNVDYQILVGRAADVFETVGVNASTWARVKELYRAP